MGALIVVTGLGVIAAATLFALTVIGLFIRLAVRLVLLPLLLVKWVLVGAVMLIVGPVLLVAAVLVMLALGVTVSLPLLPLLAAAAVIYLIVKANRRTVVV